MKLIPPVYIPPFDDDNPRLSLIVAWLQFIALCLAALIGLVFSGLTSVAAYALIEVLTQAPGP